MPATIKINPKLNAILRESDLVQAAICILIKRPLPQVFLFRARYIVRIPGTGLAFHFAREGVYLRIRAGTPKVSSEIKHSDIEPHFRMANIQRNWNILPVSESSGTHPAGFASIL
jgi:hypothetical protein